MTRMLPSRLPAKATRGEADLFRLIRDAAGSDDYVCLHSLGIARHERKDYAEADFVIVGPAGVFSLEAKGGEVHRTNGIWRIGWPGSSYESVEGPFAQSEKTRYPLRRHIELHTRLRPGDFLIGWGVAFPHITFNEKAPDWDAEVIYDERDTAGTFLRYIERLEQYFRQRLTQTGKSQPPKLSPARVAQIVDALRGDFDVVPTVRGLLADSRRELAALSTSQFRVLDYALNERNPQILCDGGAGSGKTLVAMEAARRLAADGKKVLLLCFNEQIGRFLALDAVESHDNIKVSTVYSFMGEVIRRGGFSQQLRSSRAVGDELFGVIYPALFESAAAALVEENQLPQFDVVVLDEAQDVLTTPIMNCLDLVLAGGFRSGRWLICIDTKLQSKMYQRMSDDVLKHLRSLKPAEFHLTENFRNPKKLVGEMCAVTGAERPECRRELDSNVDYRVFADEREAGRKLRALLVELMREGVPPGAITILSGVARTDSCVVKHPPDVGKPITFIEDSDQRCPPDMITATSIAAFKGLENDVIILTDLPPLSPLTEWGRSALYVGMTRARAKLYALVDQEFLDARTNL